MKFLLLIIYMSFPLLRILNTGKVTDKLQITKFNCKLQKRAIKIEL